MTQRLSQLADRWLSLQTPVAGRNTSFAGIYIIIDDSDEFVTSVLGYLLSSEFQNN